MQKWSKHLYYTAVVICFTTLAMYIDKWWIVLFGIIFIAFGNQEKDV